MGTKLFVGNLSFNTGDAELHRHFETAGEVVSAKVILDRDTNRSRGFGFVEMASATAASEACTKLDGSSLGGRELRVNAADDKPSGRSGGGGGGSRGGGGGGGYSSGRRY